MAITEVARHFYGHGQSWLFTRNASGDIAVGGADAISLPEIDSVEVTTENEKIERISKRDALASKNLSIIRLLNAAVTITCSQHTMDLLKLYLFGNKSAITGGAVSSVAFPSGIVVNDFVPFPNGLSHLSTFTSIVDSAGTPATLVQGTHYEVEAMAGVVKFLNLGSFVQPFKLNGVQDAGSGVGIFQQRAQEKWFRHKVINIADSDDPGLLDLYRVQIDPAASWQLVSDGNEPQKYEIGGQLLKDTTKSSSSTFGQYGRYVE